MYFRSPSARQPHSAVQPQKTIGITSVPLWLSFPLSLPSDTILTPSFEGSISLPLSGSFSSFAFFYLFAKVKPFEMIGKRETRYTSTKRARVVVRNTFRCYPARYFRFGPSFFLTATPAPSALPNVSFREKLFSPCSIHSHSHFCQNSRRLKIIIIAVRRWNRRDSFHQGKRLCNCHAVCRTLYPCTQSHTHTHTHSHSHGSLCLQSPVVYVYTVVHETMRFRLKKKCEKKTQTGSITCM